MKQYVLGETLYAGDKGEESGKRVTVVSLEEFREHIKGVAHRKARWHIARRKCSAPICWARFVCP